MISLPLSLSQFLTMQFIFGGTRRSCNISYVESFLILRGVVWTKNDRTKTINLYRNESNKQVSQITTEQTKATSCISLCFSPHFNMANKNAIIPASTAAIATLTCRHRSNFYLSLNQLPPRTCCRSFGSCYKT